MLGINRVFLLGEVYKDPDVKRLENNKITAQLLIITNRSHTNAKGETITVPTWHIVVCWGALAENAEKYIKKGQIVYVEGWLNRRSYKDREGVAKEAAEVDAIAFRFLGDADARRDENLPHGVSSSMNKIFLVGHVGKDLELKELEGNKARAQFTLATKRTYSLNGQPTDVTTWHNIVLWDQQARAAEHYVKKSNVVCVEGYINKRSYQDSNNVKKDLLEIVALNICLAGKKKEGLADDNYLQNDLDSVQDYVF